jgi:hypothetical protein
MYEQTLDDIYLQMSVDELIMLITSYRHDKEEALVFRDEQKADKINITIQYLRQILNSKLT